MKQIGVKNLDTGECFPLSTAEEALPECVNPLSLHIMRLTSDYSNHEPDSDEESVLSSEKDITLNAEAPISVRKKT